MAQSSRKPPEAVDDHAVVADWLLSLRPALQPIVVYADRLIRSIHVPLQYAVKWKKAYYGLPGRGWIIELAVYDVSINIVFFAGAGFEPPPPLGTDSRYVKIRTRDDVRAPEVARWIEDAGRWPGWMA